MSDLTVTVEVPNNPTKNLTVEVPARTGGDLIVQPPGLLGPKGETGVGIASANVNTDGHLILSLTDGVTVNAGTARGADGTPGSNGSDGQNGVSVTSAVINAHGRLILALSNGSMVDTGVARGADGATGPAGSNGVSVTGASVNGSGHLILTLSSGASVNAGLVRGQDGATGSTGPAGQDGISITNAAINGSGRLILTLSNGGTVDAGVAKGADGSPGATGPAGSDGQDGVSITGAVVNGSGHLILSLSTGGTVDAGNVVGPAGAAGSNGTDGVSVTGASINSSGHLILTLSNGSTVNAGQAKGDTGPAGTTTWAGITDKPATFAPSAHSHASGSITDFTEAAQDAAASLLTSGTHSGVTVVYDDANGRMNLTVTSAGSADPLSLAPRATPTPHATNVTVYARKRAGRVTPDFLGPTGAECPVQSALFGSQVGLYTPGNGNSAGTSVGLGNATSGGTVSHPTLAASSLAASVRRTRFTSATTTDAVAGLRFNAHGVHRGTAPRAGGFFFFARFVVSVNFATQSAFVGLTENINTLTGDPIALTNHLGIGFPNATDVTGNWWISTRGSASDMTRVELTGLPRSSAGDLISVYVYAAPGGDRVTFRVVNESTGVVVADDVAVTANLPAADVFMVPRLETKNGTGAVATSIDVNRVYVETDY